MKKILLTVCMMVLLAEGAYAAVTINWGYSSDLALWDASVQAGWVVYMYRDVGGDSTLSTATFDNSGTPGGGAAGDSLLASYTSTLVSGKGGINWAEIGKDVTSAAGYSVYTVLFNAASIGAAGQSVVIDGVIWTVPADPGTGVYSLGSVANSWQVVPEPSTFVLFGLGLLTIAARRRFRK